MTIDPTTQAKPGDELGLTVRVVEVKASDHKHFGLHDLVTLELAAPAGDLPTGLRFHLRRPHDGTADLRSTTRKVRKPRVPQLVLPQPTDKMTVGELLAIADARGLDTGKRPNKAARCSSCCLVRSADQFEIRCQSLVATPFVDATLPDGSRLHVVIPDITRQHWAVNIRKFVLTAHSLDELVALGTLSDQAARFLEAAVVSGLNVIVAGGTQAGKTTLLNCLAAAIPGRERVVTCEEVFELRVPLPDVVAMQTRQPNLEGTGEVRLRRLVIEALRMRPERIIVGEVRQEECLDLLIALNSGLPGMCTIHANSAREAITKLCTLPLLAGENVSHSFVVPTVASSVDVVVHIERDGQGHRRVGEIVAVPGRVEADIVEASEVFVSRDDLLVRGDGWPPHPERFARSGYDLAELLSGVGPAHNGIGR